MKRITSLFATGLLALSFAGPAWADAAADAVAMVKKAVAHVKKVGKDKAMADFNDSAEFKKGDLYVFVSDTKGLMFAHGSNIKLVGKNLADLKDADGKPFVKDYLDLANSKGSGWVDYKWINPTTKAIENKSTYVEKVDDLVIGAGIYKK